MQKQIRNLYRTQQVRELDRIAIEEFAIPGFTLMQRAGQAAFAALQRYWPEAKSLVIVCGKGNNAGDGYLVAKLAKEQGLKVTVLYLADPMQLTGDAKLAFDAAKKTDVTIMPFKEELLQADIIVDALLGTGIKGKVKTEYQQVINAINNTKLPVLAIDVPSGLCADTGNVLGACVKANATVTFVGAKQGFFTGQAPDYCGDICYDDLDIPQDVFAKLIPSANIICLDEFEHKLRPRHKTAHKGDFGHVLVIGGDHGMAGAARMAGEAAIRTGAGWTTVATRPEHVMEVSGIRPELMCYGIDGSDKLKELIAKATVIVLGPGLGQSKWGKELWQLALDNDIPKVVDADGLNLLAAKPFKQDNWILTPHPGEAARLLDCSTAEIQADRFKAIQQLQQQYGGVCILKGAGTLVADDVAIGICTAGNPGMASAGMGDVLSGIIGGLLAQGLTLIDAAKYGVLVHAKAADIAAQAGERGLLATDLLPFVRELINAA